MNNDFGLDENLDLDFTGGDFNIVDSELEHLNEISRSVKGDYVQTPNLGVDMFQFLDAPGKSSERQIKASMLLNMELDNFSTTDLSVEFDLSTNKLTVNSSGKRIR